MKMRLLKVWLQSQSLSERGLRVGKLISLRSPFISQVGALPSKFHGALHL
jgi:hypothetical protein